MRLFYEVRQTNIIIYEYSFGRTRAKKINSALKIAAVRGEVDDLPARCISLLQEVKDLIEAYNSGHENADETAAFTLSERQARPSCTVQQHQLVFSVLSLRKSFRVENSGNAQNSGSATN